MIAWMLVAPMVEPPKPVFAGGFTFLFSIVVVGWGLVLSASWFGRDHVARGGVRSFAETAWRGFATVFLVVWFAVGLLLLGLSVTYFVAYLTAAG